MLKMSTDVAAGCAFMGKLVEAVKALLEDMASNSYHWFSERATLKRSSGNMIRMLWICLPVRLMPLLRDLMDLGLPMRVTHLVWCMR